MERREVHPPAPVDDGSLQGLGKLDQQRHRGGSPCQPVGDQHRVFGGDQQPRQLRHGGRVTLRSRRHRELRNRELAAILDTVLLKRAVGDDDHRRHRRRHADPVCAHRRFGEVAERPRRVVPLRVVANHRRDVLRAVVPLGAATGRGIAVVAQDDVHGHAIAPRVVDRHRRVLQTHGAVRHHGQRLALNLEIAVAHGHRRLFVAAGDELGLLIAAVVDDRFVETAKARAGIGADVLEPERLDDVHHEVGPGAVCRQHIVFQRRRRFSGRGHDGRGWRPRGLGWGRLLSADDISGGHERGRAHHRTALQKPPPRNGCRFGLLRSRHGATSIFRVSADFGKQ